MFKPIHPLLQKRGAALNERKNDRDVIQRALHEAVAEVAGTLASSIRSAIFDRAHNTVTIRTGSKALANHLLLHTSAITAELRARGIGAVRLVIH